VKPQPDEIEDQDPTKWGFEEGDWIRPGLTTLKLLGGGSRYEAYLAHDEALWALVVVKILRPSRAADRVALEGLTAEKRALEMLNHPTILRCFGSVLEGDRPHLLLEFLEGPRLSTIVRKYGKLPLEQLIPLAVQLSSALHYMHGRRMVHLDVKATNVILGASPRLIDLSIARSFEEAAAITGIVGTDAYMAPEQCNPRGSVPVGPPADVWGLGVTLYEAVNGYLPFPRGNRDEDGMRYPQVEVNHKPFHSEVPWPLVKLIEGCMQKDASARPTARDVAEELEPLVAALPRKPVLSRLRPKLR
jgi:serine/threonine-protein kinase